MAKHKILIIDDDVDICLLLQRFFERKGFEVKTAFKGADGISLLKKEKIDLVITDFRLPDYDGYAIIEAVKKIKKEIPVIIITGYSEVNQAVKAMQLGAYEYVTKPIYPEEILKLTKDALEKYQEKEASTASEEQKIAAPFSPIPSYHLNREGAFLIPNGPYSKALQKQISLVAPTNMTVIIIGETGTGKEVVARMIHKASKRRNKAFIPVDCGALTQELAASELFGHVKGAFTGATSDKKGSFELANNGTLFLDEIGNLSYENQVKLLRVLQERVVRRVGSEKDTPINVRIIVATNEKLEKAIQKGEFREDVYYRVNEFKINLQPIRHYREELQDFIHYFIQEANQELSKSVKGISKEVKSIFNEYSWPGNIRELKNVIKHAVLLSTTEELQKDDLPEEILFPNEELLNKLIYKDVDGIGEDSLLLKEVTEKAETKAILRAIKKAKNNKTKAAKLLGIDRKTLYNKLNAYGILEE